MPQAMQRSRSPTMALAVMATMWTWGCNTPAAPARMTRVASNPSITGIWQSMNTASNRRWANRSTASWPLFTATTAWPMR